jgi:DNA polymerase-1
MEEQGVFLNTEYLSSLKQSVRKQEQDSLLSLKRLTRKVINPASSPQVTSLLKGLGVTVPTHRKTGNPDTSELALRKTSLKHSQEIREVVGHILNVRGCRKTLSTYIDGFLKRVDSQGWLHPRFLFPGTITWRLASRDPNFQNLPHGDFRTAFEAPPGWVFCEADYSQIELRIAAALAEEDALMAVFKAGGDPHGMLGRKIFKVGDDEVLSYERRHRAKTTNFGLLYGAGAPTLSDQFLKKGDYVTVAECRVYHSVFWATYSRLKLYMDQQKEILLAGGYVVAPEGGYCWSLDDMLMAHYGNEREALLSGGNAPIQSVAPRLTLRAAEKAQQEGIRIIGQVHDSLVAYLPEATARRDALRLKELMEAEGRAEWWHGVPCVVDVGIGPHWNALEKVA